MAPPMFSPVVIERADTDLVRHPDRGTAKKEAERLARANPGKAFAVYVPVVVIHMPEPPLMVEQIHNDTECDIPF